MISQIFFALFMSLLALLWLGWLAVDFERLFNEEQNKLEREGADK